MKYIKTFEQFIEEKGPCWDGYEKVPGKKDYEEDSCEKSESNLHEGFEWWQPLLSLGVSVTLVATVFFAVMGPGMILNPHSIASGDSWGDVLRHYKKKFKDKQAAKKLKKEDVLELINLIQSNIDTSDLGSGVSRYMKGLMNKLEKELNKSEDKVDKNKLLVLLRDVEKYAKLHKVKVPSDIKESINESVNEGALDMFKGKKRIPAPFKKDGNHYYFKNPAFPKGEMVFFYGGKDIPRKFHRKASFAYQYSEDDGEKELAIDFLKKYKVPYEEHNTSPNDHPNWKDMLVFDAKYVMPNPLLESVIKHNI